MSARQPFSHASTAFRSETGVERRATPSKTKRSPVCGVELRALAAAARINRHAESSRMLMPCGIPWRPPRPAAVCASLLVSKEISRTRLIVNQAINGDPTLIALERALHELRCGRAIYYRHPLASADRSAGWLLAGAETASASLTTQMQRHGTSNLALVLSRQRVATLGIDLPATPSATSDSDAVVLQLRQPMDTAAMRALAGLEPLATGQTALDAVQSALPDASFDGVIALAKRARLLPALLAVTAAESTAEALLEVSAEQLDQLASSPTSKLERISEARVPLAGSEDCRLVLFRDVSTAAEHVAILIGTSDPNAPTPVRLHSACLTGDLLGSLR
ncbi:MAG TPA: hypothetical protein VNR40_02285, partial [Steroidobacter sp.]|nr:hypothetical protein [Steroidobacter sp.]